MTRVPAHGHLGIPLDSDLDPDGNLVVIDMTTQQVIKLDHDGERLWATGRRGDGPGEFKGVYRVAVRGDGHVLVFDLQRQDVTELTAAGDFVSRKRLPFSFRQVGTMVALRDGSLVISGITRWTDRPLEHSIHVFDHDLRHVRSFGPVPSIEEEWILERWGAGSLALRELNGREQLVFSLRLPFELYLFDLEGNEEGRIEIPIETEFRPEDIYHARTEGNRTTFTTSDEPILRPHTPKPAGDGWLLAPYSKGDERGVVVISPTGRLAAMQAMGENWRSVTAIDIERGRIWVKAQVALEPVYLTGRIDIAGPDQQTRR